VLPELKLTDPKKKKKKEEEVVVQKNKSHNILLNLQLTGTLCYVCKH